MLLEIATFCNFLHLFWQQLVSETFINTFSWSLIIFNPILHSSDSIIRLHTYITKKSFKQEKHKSWSIWGSGFFYEHGFCFFVDQRIFFVHNVFSRMYSGNIKLWGVNTSWVQNENKVILTNYENCTHWHCKISRKLMVF